MRLTSIVAWLRERLTITKSDPDLETLFRKAVVAYAHEVEPWSAGKLATRDRFRAVLGVPPLGGSWDLDKPFRIINDPTTGKLLRTEGISTCGLGARGISFAAGVRWPEYRRPYDYLHESVFTVMQKHAAKYGARHHGMPKPGDHFIIGTGYCTHMGTCVEVSGSFVTSVDAGQTDPSPDPGLKRDLQCFRLIVRDWKATHQICVLDTWKLCQGLQGGQ